MDARPATRSTLGFETISTATTLARSAPPSSLFEGTSLLLDFDGTLVDIADRPQDVVVDAELPRLLAALDDRLQSRLALISGRSIEQLDAMLGPVARKLALSGSHGWEIRRDGMNDRPVRPTSLDEAADRLSALADRHAGALIERKSFGVALHYRLAPTLAQEAMRLARRIARDLGLHPQTGKMMVELRLPGADKGVAVRRLMALDPMKGTLPVFVGDDRTDEDAFIAAAELGGAGILVGEERESAATYVLDCPNAVRTWLKGALA